MNRHFRRDDKNTTTQPVIADWKDARVGSDGFRINSASTFPCNARGSGFASNLRAKATKSMISRVLKFAKSLNDFTLERWKNI